MLNRAGEADAEEQEQDRTVYDDEPPGTWSLGLQAEKILKSGYDCCDLKNPSVALLFLKNVAQTGWSEMDMSGGQRRLWRSIAGHYRQFTSLHRPSQAEGQTEGEGGC